MFLHDDLAREQAAAVLAIRVIFGGVAELEDAILDILRNAWPRVADADLDSCAPRAGSRA